MTCHHFCLGLHQDDFCHTVENEVGILMETDTTLDVCHIITIIFPEILGSIHRSVGCQIHSASSFTRIHHLSYFLVHLSDGIRSEIQATIGHREKLEREIIALFCQLVVPVQFKDALVGVTRIEDGVPILRILQESRIKLFTTLVCIENHITILLAGIIILAPQTHVSHQGIKSPLGNTSLGLPIILIG